MNHKRGTIIVSILPTFFLACHFSNYFKPHQNLGKALGEKRQIEISCTLREIGLECLLRPQLLFELHTHLDSVA